MHGFGDEVVRDLSVWLLVEDRVHQSNPGGTSPGLGFSGAILVKQLLRFRVTFEAEGLNDWQYACTTRAYPITGEARTPRQRDVADVGRAGFGHGFVDDKGTILHLGSSGLLQLPEFLQFLHDVDCKMMGGILLSALLVSPKHSEGFARLTSLSGCRIARDFLVDVFRRPGATAAHQHLTALLHTFSSSTAH